MTTETTMNATELLNSRLYWILKTEDSPLVKIVTTRAFDVSGNNSIDWTTLGSLRLSHRMHHTQASERLARHAEYRLGTGPEMKAIRDADKAAKSARDFAIANPPATIRQLDYLAALGVEIPADTHLTKREASVVIEAAQGRESIGSYGLFYQDGSN
jgi:hypothetical protein